MVARIAVVREKKFDEPRAPNTVPDAPEPNAAPASAPLPRCRSTSAIIASAISVCAISTTFCIVSMNTSVLRSCRRGNGQEFRRFESCAADQATIYVGHREQPGRIIPLDAAAIQNLHGLGNVDIHSGQNVPDISVYFLRLFRRCRLPRAYGPDRLICNHRGAESSDTRCVKYCAKLGAHHLLHAAGCPLF